MRRSKRILLSAGLLLGFMFTSPIIPTMTTYAAEQQSNLPYSRFWETQADGSWKYKYDDGTYATGWIQDDVDGNWYYMDSAGIMKSGLYKSYDRYYYFSEIHDGHFGHMLTNGEVYQGVTISADTSETYRGALSQQTISQLGLDVSKAIDITGTQHVKGGQVVSPAQENPNKSTTVDQSWVDEEQDILDKYFGGEDGELTTSGDHPLSSGNSAFASDEEIEDAFGGRGSSGTTGSKVKLHG